MAERIFRILLWLYPAEHRLAYGVPMLQHAHDLERDARQQRGWQKILLYLRLIQDGMLNAGIEQWEAFMSNNRITPAPWWAVLLAAIPGLLVVVPRLDVVQIGQVWPRLITFGYLAILAIGVPIAWYRQRRFPVWGLLPAGLLLWMAVFLAGNLLTQLLINLGWLPRSWHDPMFTFALLVMALTVVLAVFLLRGRRLSTSAWLAAGVIVLVNLLVIILFFSDLADSTWARPSFVQFLSNMAIGLLDGLMLVAAGLLAVRQHGTLAILVVIGGFGYMCMDSDFISAFRLNEWAGYTAYVISMYTLYLLVTPVALLRARTRLGRLLAVFIPVGVFLIARIAIPNLVLTGPHRMPWGDILLSVTVMLNFILAWVLYSRLDLTLHEGDEVAAVNVPPQASLS